MEKLDYAPPEATRDATQYSLVAMGAALSAWVVAVAGCATGTGWLIVLFPILSLLAVWFGVLGRKASGPGPSATRGRSTAALWLGGVQCCLAAAVMLILPQMGRAREPAHRVKCASNLRQIGQGIQMYANAHGGVYPPTFDLLITKVDLTSEVFVCPSSDHERATGPTAQAVAANFRANPLHCSYVYVGGGLTSPTVTPAHVVAYEDSTNHRGKGMNVLYSDGTVAWLEAKQAEHLLSELKAGRNPPR